MANNIFENELFLAFANASDNVYIYVCDMKDDLSRWSQNTVDYFGLPGEYIKSTGEVWMHWIHPDDRQVYLEDIQAVFSGKSARHHCQYRARNKYGDYVWLECRGSVINDEDGTPSVFAGMMTRLDNQSKYDTITHLLTGAELPNYEYMNRRGAMLLIGLDSLKKINSNFGYSYGNKLVVEFADYLSSLCNSGELLYRIQDDEFVVNVPDGTQEDMLNLMKQVSYYTTEKHTGEDGIYSFRMSAGIVEYPKDGRDYNELLSNLEHSLEYARENGLEEVVVFSKQIAAKHNRSGFLQEALSKSIGQHFQGFCLYFQPIVNSVDQRIVGCEALLRWRTDEIQDSAPGEFIRILEQTGEIRAVGLWVAEQVLQYAKKWQETYGDIQISFNVSYLQLDNDHFVNELLRMADRYQVDTSKIIVELTESGRLKDIDRVNEYFARLRERGFKIAMDDFGTEYASFGLIHNVPMDILKVDRSFVKDLEKESGCVDYAIVECVTDMCRKLNIQTVAEGIETKDLERILCSFPGVTYLQGFYYSRPVPEAEFVEMLEKQFMLQE